MWEEIGQIHKGSYSSVLLLFDTALFTFFLCWLAKKQSSMIQVIYSVVMDVRSYKDLILTGEKKNTYSMYY